MTVTCVGSPSLTAPPGHAELITHPAVAQLTPSIRPSLCDFRSQNAYFSTTESRHQPLYSAQQHRARHQTHTNQSLPPTQTSSHGHHIDASARRGRPSSNNNNNNNRSLLHVLVLKISRRTFKPIPMRSNPSPQLSPLKPHRPQSKTSTPQPPSPSTPPTQSPSPSSPPLSANTPTSPSSTPKPAPSSATSPSRTCSPSSRPAASSPPIPSPPP